MNISKLPVLLCPGYKHLKFRSYGSEFKCARRLCDKKKPMVVTVTGAKDKVGQCVSLLLKQCPLIEELRIYDTAKETCGIALDLTHIDTNTKVRAYTGIPMLKDAVEGARIILVCGGCQKKPGVSEEELFHQNADYVRTIALHSSEFNPKAIFCISTPPIDAMVPMVSEEYKRANAYNYRRIIGLTNLCSIRANSLIANYTKQNPCRILCPVIGGMSSTSTVAVLSQCLRVAEKEYETLQEKIANAENEALTLKDLDGTGTVTLSPAFAISRCIVSLIKALEGKGNPVECCFVRQMGHIGLFLPYMTSVVKFGKRGIEATHMPQIDDRECNSLQKAANSIRRSIILGEAFITGEFPITRRCVGPASPCTLIQKVPVTHVGDIHLSEEINKQKQKYMIPRSGRAKWSS